MASEVTVEQRVAMLEWMDALPANAMTLTTPAVFSEKFGKTLCREVMRTPLVYNNKVIVFAPKKCLIGVVTKRYAELKGVIDVAQ